MKCDVCELNYAEFAMLHAEPERGISWESCRGCVYAGRVPYHILVTRVAKTGIIRDEHYEIAHFFGKTRMEFVKEVGEYITRLEEDGIEL